MIVIDNATEKMRGDLTKWLLEVKPGVFIGNVSAAVRERIWDKIQYNYEHMGALLIYSFANEQGFRIEMCGDPRRSVIDIDGIQLIRIK